jgi:hypothetical protein
MSYARAARRRASRQGQGSGASGSSAWIPPSDSGPLHGGVFGTLDDGRFWRVCFPTAEEAQQFLSLLGPPPATEERLQTALKAMGRGLRDG